MTKRNRERDMGRNYINKHILGVAAIILSLVFTLAGCGAEGQDAAEHAVLKEADKDIEIFENTERRDTEETMDAEDGRQSLAKRMCGKYSYHIEGNGGDNEEYYTMHVVSFGDNLYALCSQAMADDHGSFETYSFWASEFIPYDADDMRSKDGNQVRVNELCFSVMSNAGKYWGAGSTGKIVLTNDGLLFEDFEDEEFLCPAEYGSRLFLRDDRVEEAFPYLYHEPERPIDDVSRQLQGLWMLEDEGAPVFLEFKDSNLFIYQKAFDTEVFYAAGSYTCSDGVLAGNVNALGDGKMLKGLRADYEVRGDQLHMEFEEFHSEVLSSLEGSCTFKRADAADIHLVTVDDAAEIDDQHSADLGYSYYAVFVSAAKDKGECASSESRLEKAGFESSVIFTPDFSELDPEPYYAVTAGLFGTKEAAESCLVNVKASGLDDAYVKYCGKYVGSRFYYTMDGSETISISEGNIILNDVAISLPYQTDTELSTTILHIDKNTKFDAACDTSAFENYERGDTPLMWFTRNYMRMLDDDPGEYERYFRALCGVFEVSIEGYHISAYYGSHWWD